MSFEEDVKSALIKKFDFLADGVRVVRPRRITVEVENSRFKEVLDYLADQMKFSRLCTITGLDEGDKLGVIYHLAQDKSATLNLKTWVPKEKPVIKSVISRFPVADCYERELKDLFGFQVEGLPSGNRYPLTDDWPEGQYPLRKDWKNA
jgi:membrane-bound hydrogenase subunit beta